ncbi:MAG: glycosyltransferase family 2 protein [gamma proteobacterium symbiont of Taylorina sp.]|nr:glycosyltransferase family 2 protein [gamma proteobacterium symbiont of Taylorina sp.]
MNAAFQIKQSQCLVIIPAMNEEKTIASVIQDVINKGFNVLVIDDGSADSTIKIARQFGAVVIPLTFNIGAWNATQAGIRYALKHRYNYVISMDADGQHSCETLPDLLNAAEDDDVIIASYVQRGSLNRQIAWSFFKHVAGFNFNDLTSGFRLYNRSAMLVLASRQATLLEYQDVGVLLLLTQHNLSITEIETTMSCRTEGKSRIFSSWFQVIYYMMYTSLLCFSKITPVKRLKS